MTHKYDASWFPLVPSLCEHGCQVGLQMLTYATRQLHVANDRHAEEQRTACNPARHFAFLQTDSSWLIFDELFAFFM